MAIWLAAKAIFAPAKIISGLKNTAGFVIKYWKQVAIASMLGLIFHQNFMEFELLKWVGIRTIPGIEHDYKEQIEICKKDKAKLEGAIDSLNTQVDQWYTTSQDLQQEHNKLTNELIELKKQSEQQVQDILNEETPKDCQAAIQYLKDAAKGDELKWPKQ